MKKQRVLLVDDHKILIDGIRNMLPEEKFELIDGVSSAFEAVEIFKVKVIDILITDIQMPGMTGIELIQKVKVLSPATKIIVLSMFTDKSTVMDCIHLGVNAYITKNISQRELLRALESLSKEKFYLSEELADVLVDSINHVSTNSLLTPREQEILVLVAEELSNKEIAARLFISERTVESHRKNIYRKTGRKSIVGLVRYAIDKQLI